MPADVPALRVLRWPTSVLARSRVVRPSLQACNHGGPLLEGRTQPHCSQVVRTQGTVDRARTWRTLQFVRFRELSAAHPPAPRVYRSRALPVTPALDASRRHPLVPVGPCSPSPRVSGRQSQVCHRYCGPRWMVFLSPEGTRSISPMLTAWRLCGAGAVTLERNITRLCFDPHPPTLVGGGMIANLLA